jgi:hypothetical protein
MALASGSTFAQTAVDEPPMLGGEEAVTSSASWGMGPGAYNQPEWVQRRPFGLTRVHIQRNPGEWGVEQWVRSRYYDASGTWKLRMQEEIEVGLPGRIQLDFYYDWTVEDGVADALDYAAEIRWAPADWGKLPLNPTLYFEYKWTDESRGGDVIEPKLLLGDDFGDGWHWGLNLIYEREIEQSHTEEWAVSHAISKTVCESLSLGAEMKWTRETAQGSRGSPEQKFVVGPALQWRPGKNFFVNLAVLAGTTKHSPDFEGWLVMGYNFGGGDRKWSRSPVSGRR